LDTFVDCHAEHGTSAALETSVFEKRFPMTETSISYRPIPGCPGYRAGSDGTIQSCWSVAARPVLTSQWYNLAVIAHRNRRQVWIREARKQTRSLRRVGELVLLAWVGFPPSTSARHVWHINGDVMDDQLDNLRWSVERQQVARRKAPKPERADPRAAFELARNAYELLRSTVGESEGDRIRDIDAMMHRASTLMEHYSTQRSRVAAARKGRPVKADASSIWRLRRDGMSAAQIADHLGISRRSVYNSLAKEPDTRRHGS
jgi:hypothetical protein